jgi:ABC-type lipoprotein export system ATPase subunit
LVSRALRGKPETGTSVALRVMLRAIGVEKKYKGPNGTLEILRGVDLELRAGELAFIVGRSGAGKSTLLHLLSGLDRPSAGTIEFENKNISALSERALAAYRNREVGIVFQFYHLLPELTVLENVELPGRVRGKRNQERAQMLLKRVDLWQRRDHLPNELSGGEQQRAAIARALVNDPKIVFCDEPTGNLDEETAETVQQLILELNGEGQAFCIVTHEENFTKKGKRIYRLHEGVMQPDQHAKGAS